jgi:hypothetical protein
MATIITRIAFALAFTAISTQALAFDSSLLNAAEFVVGFRVTTSTIGMDNSGPCVVYVRGVEKNRIDFSKIGDSTTAVFRYHKYKNLVGAFLPMEDGKFFQIVNVLDRGNGPADGEKVLRNRSDALDYIKAKCSQ